MLSIIVPVYNAGAYLRTCVNSILTQSYTNFELLLIDDGSTDQSGVLCDEFAVLDSRVCVFHKQNTGVASTRNIGIEIARGEWITFVDADDWIEPDLYQKVFNQLETEGADICCYDYTIVYPHKKEYKCTPDVSNEKEEYLQAWLRLDLTSLCVMVVRKTLYDENNLRCPVQNYCEDFSLSVRLIFYADMITKINFYGYNYNRENVVSLVNNWSEKATEDEIAIYRDILDFFAEHKVMHKYESAMVWRVLKSTQHLILDSNRHEEFTDIFLKRWSKYIYSVPNHYVNKKVKIMAWLLCHKMGGIVEIINIMRAKLKR